MRGWLGFGLGLELEGARAHAVAAGDVAAVVQTIRERQDSGWPIVYRVAQSKVHQAEDAGG